MAQPILSVCDYYIAQRIKESPARSNRTSLGARYGENGVAWCGIAVAMAYQDAGLNLRKILTPSMASTVAIMSAGKKKKWFFTGRNPQPTDIVCYHMPGGRRGVNHVGIVKSVTSGGIWAYEGNTSEKGSQFAGGGYMLKFRAWSLILGFVRIPGAASWGYTGASVTPPPPPVVTPSVPQAPAYNAPVRPGIGKTQASNIIKCLQFELGALCPPIPQDNPAAQAAWDAECATGYFGDQTQWKVGQFINGLALGGKPEFLGHPTYLVGSELWAVIDFLYFLKTGRQPIVL